MLLKNAISIRVFLSGRLGSRTPHLYNLTAISTTFYHSNTLHYRLGAWSTSSYLARFGRLGSLVNPLVRVTQGIDGTASLHVTGQKRFNSVKAEAIPAMHQVTLVDQVGQGHMLNVVMYITMLTGLCQNQA
ncbi:hypothetical protein POM88_014542 [Heracleum sosnowskyi]|uniref:Uncharacterized protein n=1 Tax=Heracleum sosnowskyi TaxID=360622 RepID=A0AAD8J3A6_9APIA|nr:hypothetical protein POM88_014542 [Heracleum sosnowskyi]